MMQKDPRQALFYDPESFAEQLEIRAIRLALRWEMGEDALYRRRPPAVPVPKLPGSGKPSEV